jgi:hypothetical protein
MVAGFSRNTFKLNDFFEMQQNVIGWGLEGRKGAAFRSKAAQKFFVMPGHGRCRRQRP